MKCEFSETQFMFSFVHELLNKQQVSSLKWFVPMFPTQHAEKKLGYDFKINNPVYAIFIQFKVPEKKYQQELRIGGK